MPYREASRPSAVDACQAVASHLVYIETQEEQTALEGWLYSSSDTRSSFYWIGLEGTSEDDVTWLNGDRTNYTNFEANTAFAAVSTYIGMEGPTFTWHNLDSTSIEKSICEKENDQDNGAMNQNGQGKQRTAVNKVKINVNGIIIKLVTEQHPSIMVSDHVSSLV